MIEEKLKEISQQFAEVEKSLADPEQISKPKLLQELAKTHAELAPIVSSYRELKKIEVSIDESKSMAEDDQSSEFQELIREELKELEQRKTELEDRLKILIIPKDPNDRKNAIVEIRAGTGGDEATLFGSELFRMYSRYAEKENWKVDLLSLSTSGLKGIKEVVFSVQGGGAYGKMKFEGGIHRVQRVPVTEASGRIHTSTATVAVLPEAEEVDLKIDANDLRIDVYRSSGPGGQSVNTTDSAVRITHIPTGTVASCQDEKSQHKNKAKAMKILRSRILDQIEAQQSAERANTRRSMVGSGDRSEKIRTYNFPQGRITDHRIKLTLYKLDTTLDGELEPFISALTAAEGAEKLKDLTH